MIRIRNLGGNGNVSVRECYKAIRDWSVAADGDCPLNDYEKAFVDAEKEVLVGKVLGVIDPVENKGGEGPRDVEAEGFVESGGVDAEAWG